MSYQLSPQRLELVSKHLAKKKVQQYVKEHGETPSPEIEAGFYVVTPEEKERYTLAFLSSDFVEESDVRIEIPEVIENTPEQDEVEDTILETLMSGTKNVTAESINNITLPAEIGVSANITGDFQNGATITSESTKTFYINNTSEEPIDITLMTKGTTVYLTGKFNNIYFNGRTLNGTSGNYPEINGVLSLEPSASGNVTVTATFQEDSAVKYFGNSALRINNNNNENANINILAPNSTVTINGKFDEVEASVSQDTLILTYAFHCDTLKISNSKVIYQGTNTNDFYNELIGENVTVEPYTATLEQNLNLSTPGVYVLSSEKVDSNPIVFSTFVMGGFRIDLNGHHLSTKAIRDYACLVRSSSKLVVDIVDSVGGGGITSAPDTYGIWMSDSATTDSVVNIYGGNFEAYTHVLYTQKGTFNIYGGSFKCLSEDKRYTINCYDASYTAGTANIKVYGGKFYNFDPSHSMSEPGGPVSFLADGYKVVVSQEGDDTIYTVVPDEPVCSSDSPCNDCIDAPCTDCSCDGHALCVADYPCGECTCDANQVCTECIANCMADNNGDCSADCSAYCACDVVGH